MKKDQELLEQIYSKSILNEKLSEPEFVQNRPHPVDRIEGELNVNKLTKQHDDHFQKYKELAQKILQREIKKKKYNVNFEVLKRDNFGNVNLDEYRDSIIAIMNHLIHKEDDVESLHNLVIDLATKIGEITNRYNYNPDTELSNAASINNANAKNVHAGQQFPAESTLNYLSASFNKREKVLTESDQISTLSYISKG